MRHGRAFETRDWLFLLLVTTALSAPFLNKAVHIDDPVVLRVAANAVENPLDPYQGEMDWFGHRLPLWQVTTNPPLLSYWLAPAAFLSDYSEWALHLAMTPFLLMMAAAMHLLARRFTDRVWLPVLFAVTSPAVWVSVNLMRDVPAAAMTWLGLALFVRGTDREQVPLQALGSTLCGLAVLTKYTAAVGIPLMALYAILAGKFRSAYRIWPALALAAGWAVASWAAYGQAHPIYLLSGGHPTSPAPLSEKVLGAATTVGSTIFLTPALLAASLPRRRAAAAIVGSATVAILWFAGPSANFQYLFWAAAGAIFLFLCLWNAFGDAAKLLLGRPAAKSSPPTQDAGDSAFLLIWMASYLAFSVLFVPFQAVRHLIPLIAPLVLLSFRTVDRSVKEGPPSARRFLGQRTVILLLCLQTAVGLLVGVADSQYADVYRDAARDSAQRWKSDDFETWFLGHWGWMHYAERSGFRQLHRDGPHPKPGDLLLWPERVHVGDALAKSGDLRERLELIDSREYGSALPVRTMNFRCAAFYALTRRNLPYCVQSIPLERMRVYRVADRSRK